MSMSDEHLQTPAWFIQCLWGATMISLLSFLYFAIFLPVGVDGILAGYTRSLLLILATLGALTAFLAMSAVRRSWSDACFRLLSTLATRPALYTLCIAIAALSMVGLVNYVGLPAYAARYAYTRLPTHVAAINKVYQWGKPMLLMVIGLEIVGLVSLMRIRATQTDTRISKHLALFSLLAFVLTYITIVLWGVFRKFL